MVYFIWEQNICMDSIRINISNNYIMEHKPKYQFIAIISGFLTIFAFSHLFYNVYKTKNTVHLSYTWILLVLSAQSLLMIYGIINNAYGIYLPASIIILGLVYIVYVKINYNKNKYPYLKNKIYI